MPVESVAILGPGLLGGSIALALRERGGVRVSIWGRRPEAVERCRPLVEFASTNATEVVHGTQLVIFCTPIGAMSALAHEIVVALAPETLVTDVGSVKGPVVAELGELFQGRARFVGSHPMAGSEQTGIEAARADLFQSATCILTPTAASDAQAVGQLASFWQMLGCHVRELSPAEHDEAVALVSHFPHLLAAALVEMVGRRNPAALELCGPGFRSTTRVASGPPAMWTEILRSNREAVRAAADAMIEKLHEMRKLLAHDAPADAMHDLLFQAKTRRDSLRGPR